MTTTAHPPDDVPAHPRSASTWYDVLDVARDADGPMIQLAYERAIALIEGKHLGAYFVLDPAATAAARRDIEAAFVTLSDQERRRAYDRSLVGDDTDPALARVPAPSRPPTSATVSLTPRAAVRFLAPIDGPAPLTTTMTPPTTTTPPMTTPPAPSTAHRRIDLPSTPTPTPPPGLLSLDGEVNGQTLRRLREFRRLELDELAEATKIRRAYLAAIEEQDFENLPSRVYLRGFLTQIARVLRVDKNRLADGYLAFIARYGG
jgi:hypothetical protein